jgi:hypothetical protein
VAVIISGLVPKTKKVIGHRNPRVFAGLRKKNQVPDNFSIAVPIFTPFLRESKRGEISSAMGFLSGTFSDEVVTHTNRPDALPDRCPIKTGLIGHEGVVGVPGD